MKRGPRIKYFICIAKKGDQILALDMPANSSEEAGQSFAKRFGVVPKILDGDGEGFYRTKGHAAIHDSVYVKPNDILPTGKNFTARLEIRNVVWNILAMGVQACWSKGERYEDNELCIVHFVSAVDGRKGCRPKVKRTELFPISKMTHVARLVAKR